MRNRHSEKELQKRTAKLEKELATKARQLEIEQALERVRSRTMAMQKSDELRETTLVLFQQFKSLKATTSQVSICVFDEETKMGEMFVTLKGEKIDRSFPMELDKEVFVMKKAKKAFLARHKNFSFIVKGKELQNYNHWRNTLIGKKGWDESSAVRKQAWYVNGVFFSRGLMGISSDTPPTPEALKLLDRFASLFDLTFTRFLDLQKAEAQAKEAQIEAALERVRTRTMAMHRSEEIADIVGKIFGELKLLDLVLNRVLIWTFNDKERYVSWWSANPEIESNAESYRIDYNNQPVFRSYLHAWQKRTPLHLYTLSGDRKKKWEDHLFSNTELAKLPAAVRKGMRGEGTIFTTSTTSDYGLMMVGSFKPLSAENTDIIQRFGRVFQQSYTRYLDVQKAEAQAREAQIEAALERVRSRTMAMHQTSELQEVIHVVHRELLNLSLSILGGSFVVINDDVGPELRCWGSGGTANTSEEVHVPHFGMPFCTDLMKGIKKGPGFFTEEFSQKEKKDYFTKLFQRKPWSDLGSEQKRETLSSPGGYTRSVAVSKHTSVFIINHQGRKFTEDENDILRRFAKVFEQTYTRFLDLKKAEAQAREAQIELGLERVRARAMAMQRSDELKELIGTVSTELGKLDIVLDRCFIVTYDPRTMDSTWWMANPETPSEPIGLFVKYHDYPAYRAHIEAWKERKITWEYILEGEVKKTWDSFLFTETELSQLPSAVIRNMRSKKKVYLSSSFNNFGYLQLATLEPLTGEQFDIMLRFARVFDLTYTRFNDLKQAEAQTREARIEAALEKVRARTMGMQRSEELPQAANLLFQQIQSLGMPAWSAGYCIWDEDKNGITLWMSSEGVLQPPFHAPLTEDPLFIHMKEAYERGEMFFVDPMGGDDLVRHYQYMRSLPVVGKILDSIIEAGHPLPTFQIMHLAYFSRGFLLFITYEPVTEAHDIFKRFGNVFDQTYTRFLDLKNAEAQAREAQIQLALERVRARTMAMHKSVELAETAQVLFQQLLELGGIPDRIAIGVVDESGDVVNFWSTDQSGSHVDKSFEARLNERTVISKAYQAWKNKEKSLVIDLHGEDLKEWLQFVRTEMKIFVKDEFIKDRRVHNFGFFSHGWILVTTHEPQSAETIQILERFTSVFNLTYRRFLDLEKAESQAREAQIEAALERVRSRSMAMHQSGDLHEVIKVITEQLLGLGLRFDASNFARIDSEGSWDLWISTPEQVYPALVHVPYLDHGLFNKLIEVIKQGGDFLVDTYDQHQKNIFFEHFFENTVAKSITPEVRKQYVMSCKGFARSVFLTKNIWLAISNYDGVPFSSEQNAIFKRFANAFEQTYTRFLDLQKAEAQAREAHIEAALERVRSRSLAMHKSDELSVIAKTMFEQLRSLGLELEDGLIIMLFREDSRDQLQWPVLEGLEMGTMFMVPYFDHPVMNEVYKARETGVKFIERHFDKTIKDDFLEKIFSITDYRVIPVEFQQRNFAGSCYHYSFAMEKFTGILMHSYNRESYPAEYNDILRRFARVFEQAYVRFLDLQKAEAQAKEAQIEASLEKVRSSAMAMHNSNDISSTTTVVFAELKKLGIRSVRCGVALLSKNSYDAEVYAAATSADGELATLQRKIKMSDHSVLMEQYESWLKQENCINELRGEQLKSYYRLPFFYSSPNYVPRDDQGQIEWGYYIPFSEGFFYAWNDKTYSDEEFKILNRFKVNIALTFRRYFDLQKAEANAREAQIEASLERVRAKAMAMHSSQDLAETIKVFYQQLDSLKLMPRRCGVGLLNKDTHMAELMGMVINEQGETKEITGQLALRNHPVLENVYSHWMRQEDYHPVLRGNEIREYYRLVASQIPVQNYPDDAVQFGYFFSFPEGQVYAWTDKQFIEDELKIYRRFTSVLSLTYKRYKDLKQAEAQVREAQIEAGLERVRARTMAMHTSDDVSAATATMFSELEKLGIENFRGGITNMLPNRTQHVWSVNNLAEARLSPNAAADDSEAIGRGKVVKAVGAFNMDDHPFWQQMYKEWQEKNDFTHYFLAGREKEDYVKILNSTQGYLARAIENFPDVHFQVYFFNEGGVWTNSLHAHTDEEQQIMKRFTAVFSLTFRRYQDLRKAEAQAREATIEAALEKVRGKAMAMHNSNDLSVTASMIFTELRKLGINPIRCGVGLLNKESRKAQLYSATSSADGDSLSLVGWVILSEHPVLQMIYDTWLNNEEYYPELQGEQMRLYYEQLLKGLPVTAPSIDADKKQYGHFIPFSVGCLYAWSETSYSESEIKILKRFATIIDLTFRRYMELQHSEMNAREAVKQAALDRIRADIASMRTITDLDRITPLIWNELTILGLPFIRCGVFIMDDVQRFIHTFLSTPDGRAIAAFHLPYSTPGNIQKVISHWHDGKNYIDHWDESDFTQFAEILVKENALASAEAYLKTIPHGGFYLHFLPFLQGMLYVGNTTQLSQENIQLIQSVADAFSTAYARYEDFNKLEAAKQQVEKTLTDLKQAQTQLVQSEKMASLGELTAGIAHEIQNPLNFVNNFSEVSNELIEELKNKNEKLKIDDAEVKELLQDITQNLEKINFHGKRADAIVKGMLQHSRTSSGQKEMTDINVLADEYLRLAFHGLRAKDKSFNAKFESNFDENVGKIDIIQQDIGRVILNLINNAFYAVNEKKKQAIEGYEPTVTISTVRDNGKIEVKVKDNGNGISQKNLDKIFQPFFTTKPTGQGTGLGLSLAYDIVKAHGGEIKVQTQEGEGSEFIVQLPGV